MAKIKTTYYCQENVNCNIHNALDNAKTVESGIL